MTGKPKSNCTKNMHLCYSEFFADTQEIGRRQKICCRRDLSKFSGILNNIEKKGNNYRKMILKSGVMIGFILIGDTLPASYFLSKMKRGDIIADPAELLARGGDAATESCRNRGARQYALFRQYNKKAYRYTLVDTDDDHHQDKKGDRQ